MTTTPTFPPPRQPRPPRSIAAALGSVLALVGLLGGVPIVLTHAAGWPLPRSFPDADELHHGLTTPIDQLTIVKIIACITWLVWIYFVLSVLAETRTALTGRGAGRDRLGPGRALARRLVSAALVIATSAPAARAAAAAPPTGSGVVATKPVNAAAASDERGPRQPAPVPPAASDADGPTAIEPGSEVTVRDGDHLWALAERAVADVLKRTPADHEVATYWRRVVAANRDRFPDPSLIYRGQRVVLPPVPKPTAQTREPRRHETSRPGPGGPRAQEPPKKSPAPPSSSPTAPAPPSSSPTAPAPPPANTLAPEQPGPVVVVRRTIALPSGAVVAASFLGGIAAAHTVGRLRRRRLYQPGEPAPLAAAEQPPSPLRAAMASTAIPDAQPSGDGASWLFHGLSHDNPAVVPFAHRDSQPVLLDLLNPGSLAVRGPTAVNAARAAATALLAHAGPRGARLVVPAPTYDILFADSPAPPNVTRTTDVAAALAELEVERVHRLRLLDHYDETDIHTHRTEHPEDPLPVVLLITTDLTGHEAAYQALLDGSARLGIAALHLGDATSPRQATIELDHAGTILHAEGAPDAELTGTTAYVLTAAEAAETFTTLASAVADAPQAEPVQPTGEPLPTPATVAPSPRVSVRLLGTYQISVDGNPVRKDLLRAARELLAYYAIHVDGATADTALETLWPDSPAKSAKDRWDNAVGSLHRCLRAATGLPELTLIRRDGEFYRLATELVDVDLWHLQKALTEAQQAVGTDTAPRTLREVIDRYTGDLLDGAPYGWAEPLREGLRRRVLDACSRLADQVNSLAERLAVLERAITIDPYAEHFYRTAMRIHLTNGDRDAARRLYRQLETHLAELDVEPDNETASILRAATTRRLTPITGSGRQPRS